MAKINKVCMCYLLGIISMTSMHIATTTAEENQKEASPIEQTEEEASARSFQDMLQSELFDAIRELNADKVKEAINQGANPHRPEYLGFTAWTPLEQAMHVTTIDTEKYVKVAQTLLDHGAPITDIPDNATQIFIQLRLKNSPSQKDRHAYVERQKALFGPDCYAAQWYHRNYELSDPTA